MKGTGVAIGGLLAIIGLIIYEQISKPVNAAASTTSSTIAPSTTTAPAPSGSAMNNAAQSLPKFSEGANPSIIDFSATPVFNGSAWTCPNGDLPYYDPNTQTVYCVLPGMNPNSAEAGNPLSTALGDGL